MLPIEGMRSSSNIGTQVLVAAGAARDATDTVDMSIPSGQTRVVDVTVAGPGGITGGTVQPNTSYALYVVQNAEGAVHATISPLFEGFTAGAHRRRIGALVTGPDSKVVGFTQFGTGNGRTVEYSAASPVLIAVNNRAATTFEPFPLGPGKPTSAPTARLYVVPTGGPTTVASGTAGGLEITVATPTTLGFTPPLGSNMGSFKTAAGATTMIGVTGFAETL